MLALIAGQGRLPAIVFEQLVEQGARPLVAELSGFAAGTPVPADVTFRLETLASFFEDLRGRGVTKVVFAGRVRRPVLDPAVVDPATQPLIRALTNALRDGDDGALRIILDMFSQAGFEIVSAQDVAPQLLPSAGAPTRRHPGRDDGAEARRGLAVIAAMGAADVGQACVVAQGVVLAVEAAAGTDWMLDTLTRRS